MDERPDIAPAASPGFPVVIHPVDQVTEINPYSKFDGDEEAIFDFRPKAVSDGFPEDLIPKDSSAPEFADSLPPGAPVQSPSRLAKTAPAVKVSGPPKVTEIFKPTLSGPTKTG